MFKTKEQIAEECRAIAQYEYELYSTRLAASTNNKFSDHHPDNIRKEIKWLQDLLEKALS
jgi:hypothetical protein